MLQLPAEPRSMINQYILILWLNFREPRAIQYISMVTNLDHKVQLSVSCVTFINSGNKQCAMFKTFLDNYYPD